MNVIDWAGTLFFVTATFRRTRTLGMVSMQPVDRGQTVVYVRVAVPRSPGRVRRVLWDAPSARIRRFFIRKFLEPDVARSAGTRYNPGRLIGADRWMADYFAWLRRLHGAEVFDAATPMWS
jgi:hypothetical protein